MLGFTIALFMATSKLGSTRAFGFAGIVGLFGSIFLATMKLMPWWFASLFILVGIAGVAIMLLSNEK